MSSKTKSDSKSAQRSDSKSDTKRTSDKESKSHGATNNADAKRAKDPKSKTRTAPRPPEDPIYNVYLVYFNSIWPRLSFEVGLLIATDERIIRKGHYYQVKGPAPARGYKDRAEYHLYYSIIKSPENSMYFRKIAHIGEMRESKLYLPLRIAEQIPPPQVALTYRGEPPNCIDWMNNFLFELARFEVIDFDPDFEPPKEKRLLTHPSLLSPDELVSIGMSPTLSDRYVPLSKYGSSGRKQKEASQSKQHQSSQNQAPSSSSNNDHSSSSKPVASSSKQPPSSSRKPESSSKKPESSSKKPESSSKKPESSSKKPESSSKKPESSSRKPESSSKNVPPSSKDVGSSSKQHPSSSAEPSSSQLDKSKAASKSGKIPSSSRQGKDDSKHKHLSIRRLFTKK